MFTKVIKEHQVKQAAIKEENERLRKVAVSSVSAVTNSLMDSVNGGVATVFSQQRKLEVEAKILQTQANRFCRQTTQWLTLLDNFNQSLKELGDLENWAKAIESDMQNISSALEYVYKSNPPAPRPVPEEQ